MNIAITADPDLPVPPTHYGGIERVIALLVKQLRRRGHDVTLLAHCESQTEGRLVPYRGKSSQSLADTCRNVETVTRAIVGGQFDIVHSFGRLAYLSLILPMRVPKLMSYQRPISSRSIEWGCRLANGTLQFSACSEKLKRHLPAGLWHVVYNAVPTDVFGFNPHVKSDAPLVFLGRIEHIKGTHLAIETARRTGRRLVIAGNVPTDAGSQGYFQDMVKPFVDGDNISYIGPVNDQQKLTLLRGAAALLMPVLWDEPFGIVMAEALACGTPVVGLSRGAVPEVVRHECSGFVCQNVDEMVAAIGSLESISRQRCRIEAEARFSGDAMTDAYLSVYQDMMARQAAHS